MTKLDRQERLKLSRQLWEECFPDDTQVFLDFYFSRVAKAEDTYLYCGVEGDALGHIGVLRYTCRMPSGETYRLAYISGACTAERARRIGVMQRLMARVRETERELGTDALILIPASEELRYYYRRHFYFLDTARRYTLDEQSYLQFAKPYIAHNHAGRVLADWLIDYADRRPAVRYTSDMVQAVLEEYSLAGLGRVWEFAQEGQLRAGALVREALEAVYIDRILADSPNALGLLIEKVKREVGKPLLFTNLFQSDLHCNAPLDQFPNSEPWGMALPLNQRSLSEDWSLLEISLVYN